MIGLNNVLQKLMLSTFLPHGQTRQTGPVRNEI